MKRGWSSSSCHSSVYMRAALMRLPQTNLYTVTQPVHPKCVKIQAFFFWFFFWGEKKQFLEEHFAFRASTIPCQENDWKDRWSWCIMYHLGWLYSSQKWISSNIEPSTTKQLQSLIEEWWWIYPPSLRVGTTGPQFKKRIGSFLLVNFRLVFFGEVSTSKNGVCEI